MAWSKTQAKMFVKDAISSVGRTAWDMYMSGAQRKSLIAEKCLSIVTGQACESVAVGDIEQLYRDMKDAAGIEGE